MLVGSLSFMYNVGTDVFGSTFSLIALPSLNCSYLRSFSSDTCQEESSEWRAQEKEWLFMGKSRAVIGWKGTNEKASLVYNL